MRDDVSPEIRMRWYPMKQDDRRFLVTGFNVVNPRAVDGHVMRGEGRRGGGCHRRTDQSNYKRESRSSKGESRIPFNSRHIAGRPNNSDIGIFGQAINRQGRLMGFSAKRSWDL